MSEIEDFKQSLREKVNNYIAVVEDQKTLEEIQEAFRNMLQDVMDEVDKTQNPYFKLLRVNYFREILEIAYGKKNIEVENIIQILYERMLLLLWGCDNPHNPFK